MSIIEIYYHQYDGINYESSSLDIDGVGYEPETLVSVTPKNAIYYNCPSWLHKAKRTFLIRSPIDVDLYFIKNQNGESQLFTDHMTEYQFNNWVVSSTFGDQEWYNENIVTLQFDIPKFLFWTNHKNVWIELKSHSYTASKNNLVSIGGWWNLSEWERPTSFAFDVVDREKKIIIKRGDPIQEVCFHTKSKNDVIKLVKKQPSKKILERTNKILGVKKYVKRLSNDLIFKETKNKCPFEFLWKMTPQDKG